MRLASTTAHPNSEVVVTDDQTSTNEQGDEEELEDEGDRDEDSDSDTKMGYAIRLYMNDDEEDSDLNE